MCVLQIKCSEPPASERWFEIIWRYRWVAIAVFHMQRNVKRQSYRNCGVHGTNEKTLRIPLWDKEKQHQFVTGAFRKSHKYDTKRFGGFSNLWWWKWVFCLEVLSLQRWWHCFHSSRCWETVYTFPAVLDSLSRTRCMYKLKNAVKIRENW